ncbi:MAG TPA: class I SAM-dependent methyltransferase [Terriglobales bacterium]|nr:class I SAM-dependent methyltransferase [Terriglobales bacterium]
MTYDEKTAVDYAQLRTVHRPLLTTLIASAGINAGSRVLELGCGTGNYISALQSQTGCVAWGLDPSRDMLSKARSPGGDVTWICAPAENTHLTDIQLDFVFSVDAIHHFHDRVRAFSEINRLLSERGTICIATDSEEIIRNRTPLSVYWPETIEIELARYPRMNTLETELRDTGFVDLRHEEVRAVYQLSDLTPYRAKVFSCLRLLSEETFQRGLECLKKDVRNRPISSVSRYHLLWAKRFGSL